MRDNMKFKDWIKLPPDEQGEAIDNRNEPPIDVTDEHYHSKYDTISCPHCGCTLASHVVMEYRYCYVCGGRFAKRKITCDRCDAQGTSRCDCEDDERIPKDFDCNDCAYCMSNCHDMSIYCEDETGRCDYFELWENDK